MTVAEDALAIVQRMHAAWDAMDWDAFAAMWHEHGTFESVAHVRTSSLAETLEYERNNRVRNMVVTRDMWCANDEGRVWCRFYAEWRRSAGGTMSTSGASTALVVDGKVESVISWMDPSFDITY